MSEFSDQQLLEFLATEHADDVPLGTSHLVKQHLLDSTDFRDQVINDIEIAQRADELLLRVDSSLELVLEQIHQIRKQRQRVFFGWFVIATALGFGIAWIVRTSNEDVGMAESEVHEKLDPIGGKSSPTFTKTGVSHAKSQPAVGVGSRTSKSSAAKSEGKSIRVAVGKNKVESSANLEKERPSATGSMADAEDHPLLIESDRENYNFRTELASSLSAHAIREVCLQISSAGAGHRLGLIEDLADDRLLQCRSVFIEQLIRRESAVQREMISRFAAIGQLRFKSAVMDQDSDAVRRTAVQFTGTEAANAARMWLGDRAFVEGNFAAARRHYRMLNSSGTDNVVDGRLSLVNALADKSPDAKLPKGGAFGLSAEEFAELIAEIRNRETKRRDIFQRPAGLPIIPLHNDTNPLHDKSPTKLALERLASINAGLLPSTRTRGLATRDWLGRGLGMVLAGTDLIAASDTRLGRLQLETSKSTVAELGSFRGIRPDMTGTAFWPLKIGERVISRAVLGGPPTLHGVDANSMKLQWTSDRNAVSDAFVVNDRLFAITSELHHPLPSRHAARSRAPRWVRRPRQPVDRSLKVYLEEFDPINGQSRAKHELAQFDDRWNGVLSCGVAFRDDLIVATVGATVICVNLAGEVQWLRRQPWSGELALPLAIHGRPIVNEQSVIAYQPSGGRIECLDLTSGVMKWSAEIELIEHVVGTVGGWLIVETADEIQGIEATLGEERWVLPLINLTACHAQSDAGHLIVVFLEQINADQWRPVLAWIDAKTGKPIAEQPIDSWLPESRRRSVPSVGPIVHGESGFLVGYSSDNRQRDSSREIWRIRVGTDRLPPIPNDSPLQKLQVRRILKKVTRSDGQHAN